MCRNSTGSKCFSWGKNTNRQPNQFPKAINGKMAGWICLFSSKVLHFGCQALILSNFRRSPVSRDERDLITPGLQINWLRFTDLMGLVRLRRDDQDATNSNSCRVTSQWGFIKQNKGSFCSAQFRGRHQCSEYSFGFSRQTHPPADRKLLARTV